MPRHFTEQAQAVIMSVIFCHLVEGSNTVYKADCENGFFDFIFGRVQQKFNRNSFSHEYTRGSEAVTVTCFSMQKRSTLISSEKAQCVIINASDDCQTQWLPNPSTPSAALLLCDLLYSVGRLHPL